MVLNKDFVFSANNLQAYLDCPRLFELKYLLKQKWPAVISKPVQEMESKIQKGIQFHQLIHQYLSGIPANILENFLDDPDIKEWFNKFLVYINPYLDFPYFSEISLVMPIKGYRITAIFDFITRIDKKSLLIADWKTTTFHPKKDNFIHSVQSLLYPLIAYEDQQQIFSTSEKLDKKAISMEYWFPAYPDLTISLTYSESSYQNSLDVISKLISEIAYKEPGSYEKTGDNKRCQYCQYRSLCERGIQAGIADDAGVENENAFQIDSLDFDQIDEIAF